MGPVHACPLALGKVAPLLREMKTRISFPNVEISRCIKASPEALWDILTDTTRWPTWGPSVVDVQCPHKRIQKGSRGRVKTALGLWIPFLVTDFELERYWSWRVFGVRATGHRVEKCAEGLSRLTFEVPLLGAPYVIVCRGAISRIADILE